MGTATKRFVGMAALVLAILAWGYGALAQGKPSPRELLEKLKSEKTADQAGEQLLQLAKSDPAARRYLAQHLPSMIEKDPKTNPPAWRNAVRLAGALRLVEAAPALAKWLGLIMGDVDFSLSSEERLEYNSPGQALVQIGDPAVPSVRLALASGNLRERERATYVLLNIGSDGALAALREHLAEETDADLRASIQMALRNRGRPANP